MKIMAINGSPRKAWNTATLLNKALEGAASQGAETELIQLYDLNYKGCTSCFSCKLKGGKSYGKCAVNDDVTPILGRIKDAGAIILGSPIYLGVVTGEMRSFLERLTFPYLVYDREHSSLFKKKLPVGLIYTMGAPESRIKEAGYDRQFTLMETIMKRIFGASESLLVTDTYQFDDYSKYVVTGMDVEAKAKRRKEVFPRDCKKAYEMGVRFASSSSGKIPSVVE
jgi:Multimeric flavodoxin WrbA